MSNKNSYLIQLDGIRAIAVSIVMISHFVPYKLIRFVPLGSMGVNIFFVLSGFLITRILIKSKIENELINRNNFYSLKQFYFRRTLRIFPIYYLTIFTLYLFHLVPDRAHLYWLLSYLMNIKFSLPDVWESNYFTAVVHFWSLCVEEQFYLFFPFLVLFISTNKLKKTFLFLIFIGLFSRFLLYYFNAPLNSLYVLTPTCFDAFGIGALLAYLYIFEKEKLKKILDKRSSIIILVLVFILGLIISRHFIINYKECRTVLERFLFSLCCFYFVGIAALGNYKGKIKLFLENPLVLYTGKISYGLYIFHNFVPYLMNIFAKKYNIAALLYIKSHLFTSFIFYTLITFIIATLSWHIIEYPISKLKNKY